MVGKGVGIYKMGLCGDGRKNHPTECTVNFVLVFADRYVVMLPYEYTIDVGT